MRRLFRLIFLVVLGLVVGLIGYEAIMFVRVSFLRKSNPSSTSLIDTRIREAEAKGQQPRREQAWVPLEKISPNLQRAVLAGDAWTQLLTSLPGYAPVREPGKVLRMTEALPWWRYRTPHARPANRSVTASA